MKPFNEYLGEETLDEGIVRSGSVATLAARSAAAGKKADQAYKRGLSALDTPSDRDDIAKRLDRIDAALKAILEGHLHQSQQIGNHVGLDTVGHLATQKPRR